MAQTIRLTITPDIEHALQILRQSTFGTLNTTELIKMAVGRLAHMKKQDMTAKEMNLAASNSFYEWAKEDKTLDVDNIAHPEKLKPYIPETHVRTR